MDIAHAVSARSKDPATNVGCVIVNQDKRIIGTGYNGMPPGMTETEEMWQRPEKYQWVIHSEIGALVHSTQPVKGGTLYCTMFPCAECAKAIASSGIVRVVYKNDKYDNEITRKLFSSLILEQLK